MAWPVWWSPRTQIFGHELAGRHYDPFVVMQQFATHPPTGAYRQPLTDDLGAILARLVGPVPAYNLLVLVSFPLTAVAAYLLGRYLLKSHGGSMVAALLFAFAPAHVAHASYHVHIAQTQWIPLFLLALFGAVDRPTAARLSLLGLAVGGLVLSNAYGALIGAVVTPIALGGYWFSRDDRQWRGLVGPLAALVLIAIAAGILIAGVAPELLRSPQQFAFPREDLARYGARWWAYFVPPVDHPVLGGMAGRLADRTGVGVGLLEQQVSLGWGAGGLALAGIVIGLRPSVPAMERRAVVAIAGLGAWAFFSSLAPSATGCSQTSILPACLVYPLVPMFRAYARIGLVTNLSVALLAGYAVARVRGSGGAPRSAMAPLVAAALTLAAFEIWPLPGRARDVLPTVAHRWLTTQAAPVRTLDCAPSTIADTGVPWLMQQEIQHVQPATIDSCDEPGAIDRIAALKFTHVIARVSPPTPYSSGHAPPGLELAASFPDARVYRVVATPAVATIAMRGFFDWERSQDRWWRWMGPEAAWTVVNTTSGRLRTSLAVTLESFHTPRQMAVSVDGQAPIVISVPVASGEHVLGPIELSPGPHEIRFRSLEPAARPQDVLGTTDWRPLTVALLRWSWTPSAADR